MKRFLLIFFIGSLIGCKNFETKKLTSDKIFQDELRNMDWENLDSYPSLDACDEFSSKSDKKQCFEREITSHIFKKLQEHEVILKDSIYEQIELTINISSSGEPELEKVKLSENLEKAIPDIKDWLEEGISSLPEVYPAEKRGVPVSSKFKLPLVIVSE